MTRAFFVVAPQVVLYPHHLAITGDFRLYAGWSVLLADGRFPVGDPSWQYPPGAGLLLALPRLVAPGHYDGALLALFVLLDAAVLALLLLLGRRGGGAAGGWLWVLGTTALGPIVVYRFDVAPALLTVAAVAAARRPAVAGGLLAVGAAVKVWPALLLAATRDRGRALFGAVVVGVLTLLGLLAAGRLAGALDFLHNQRARGLQVETVWATPYLLAHALGAGGVRVVHEYGAYQVLGPGAGVVVRLTTLANLAVVVGYLLAARRRPGDLPLALGGLLAVLVTARVLSPQYLVWALAVAAADVAVRRDRPGRVATLLVVVTAVTQLLYPMLYNALLRGELLPALVLTLRNALLVATAVVAWRQGMTRPVATKNPNASAANASPTSSAR